MIVSSATVLYVLEVAGNMAQSLPQIAGGLDAVRTKAQAATSAVGGGLKAGIGAGRQALNEFAEGAQKALEGVAKVGGSLAIMAAGVNVVLQRNVAWQESTARLVTELGKLGDSIADALGPTAARWLDAFTLGLVAIVTFLQNAVVPAFTVLADLFDAVKTGLVEWITLVKKILAGDFKGAFDSVFEAQRRQIGDLKQAWSDAQEGFESAKAAALDAAKATYGRATDGKSDIGIKSVSYTDAAKVFQDLQRELRRALDLLHDKALPALEKAQGPAQAMADELPGLVARIEQGLKAAALQNAAGAVAGFGAAAQGGLAGVASAYGGPIGALVGAILGLVEHLPDLIGGLVDEAAFIFVGLPDMLAEVIGQVLPAILTDQVPKIIAALPLLTTSLGFAILRSIPALVGALIQVIPKAAAEFVRAIRLMLTDLFSGSLWSSFGRRIVDGFKGALAAFNQIGDDLGIHLGAKASGHKSLFGIHIPKLDEGGRIVRSGLVYAHQGEEYLGAPGSRAQRASSSARGGPIYNIASLTIGDIRSIADQLRRGRGSYGIGLKIDPLA